MVFLSHLSVGYLLSVPATDSLSGLLIISGSILPDIDAFFFKYVKDHHKSPLHYPLFWLFLSILAILFSEISNNFYPGYLVFCLTLGIYGHLFFDWIFARSTGIMFFYPFSRKNFSILPLEPKKGKVSVRSFRKQILCLSFYLKSQNRILLFLEVFIIIFSVLVFFKRNVLPGF